jgi:hypothetical protein
MVVPTAPAYVSRALIVASRAGGSSRSREVRLVAITEPSAAAASWATAGAAVHRTPSS